MGNSAEFLRPADVLAAALTVSCFFFFRDQELCELAIATRSDRGRVLTFAAWTVRTAQNVPRPYLIGRKLHPNPPTRSNGINKRWPQHAHQSCLAVKPGRKSVAPPPVHSAWQLTLLAALDGEIMKQVSRSSLAVSFREAFYILSQSSDESMKVTTARSSQVQCCTTTWRAGQEIYRRERVLFFFFISLFFL